MKILITGVCGNIGRFLCDSLKDDNEIIGLDIEQENRNSIRYYKCDITNKKNIEEVMKQINDIDIIIHCAALAHKKGNDLSQERFMDVNYNATKYFIDLSNKYLTLKNFIFISTISVYGETLDKDTYVEGDECEPKSPYALAKRLSEEYIQENCESNFTIFRLAPVYSEEFMLNIERRSRITNIFYKVGSGSHKLSLCNINNIYEGVKYILNNTKSEECEIYNISDRKIYEYNDLHKFLKAKKVITIPKSVFKMLYLANNVFAKNQFLHENSLKLISDNIYSSEKINRKVNMKHQLNL